MLIKPAVWKVKLDKILIDLDDNIRDLLIRAPTMEQHGETQKNTETNARYPDRFDQVIEGCASTDRSGHWITSEFNDAYRELHRLGWAHSVETFLDGELVGGLYGLQVGGLFAGESMFHRESDASKVALVRLVEHMRAVGATLLDTQWATPHLETLGAIAISRDEYLIRLVRALA